MRRIVAIGGAVVKTARDELKEIIKQDKVEMLIHNGGSIFHDFQLGIDSCNGSHSYPLDDLLEDYECNRLASEFVWDWILNVGRPPENSITHLCEEKGIRVLLFTVLGGDFWQLFVRSWNALAERSYSDFHTLSQRFTEPFHYVCMGSAVVHPEVFIKAVAKSKQKDFRADVVDFLDMYRPRTRISKYGNYYKMTHKEYLQKWMKD